jgi:hypothetical protein
LRQRNNLRLVTHEAPAEKREIRRRYRPAGGWDGGLLHRGYIQSWNATFERRLPLNMIEC